MKLLVPLLLGAALLAQPAPPGKSPSRWKHQFGGYNKALFSTSNTYFSHDAYGDLMNRLRLSYDSRYSDWFQAHIDYDNEAHFGNLITQPEFDLVRHRFEASWVDLQHIFVDSGHAYWDTSLYRGYVTLRGNSVSLTAGRQRIGWGTARFWSPADVFNPINPLQIEATERQGVDAAYVEWDFTSNLTSSTAYLPQNTWRQSTLATRLSTNVAGYDLDTFFGRFEQDWMGGADFAGQWGGVGLRGEITYRKRHAGSRMNDPLRLTFGADYAFANTLYLITEYFYNQGQPAGVCPPGVPNQSIKPPLPGQRRLAPNEDRAPGLRLRYTSEIFTLHRHFLSGGAGYDVTPLFHIETYTVADLAGKSFVVLPRARYNLTPNTDLTLGAQLFASRAGGEFDGLSHLLFVELLFQF